MGGAGTGAGCEVKKSPVTSPVSPRKSQEGLRTHPSQDRFVSKVAVLLRVPARVRDTQQRSQAAREEQNEGRCLLQVP